MKGIETLRAIKKGHFRNNQTGVLNEIAFVAGLTVFHSTICAALQIFEKPISRVYLSGLSSKVISSVVATIDQAVKQGDLLCTIEAMKMETGIAAENYGVVKAIHAPAGSQVDAKDLLIEFES